VEGYCDSVGSSVYNLSLSNRRVGSVKKYFISQGIPANRISAIGYGEANPIATNLTEEGRAKNRRVEIKAKK
jgi:OOP family OmpA-OmpF porin